MTGDAADLGRAPRYRVFGLTLESEFDFRTPLRATDRPPDIRFTCSRSAPVGLLAPASDPVFSSRAKLESGVPALLLYASTGLDVIRYSEVADFYLTRDRIHCHILDPAYDYMVEIHLLGVVFAFWFERRGVPMLHASAVSVEGRAAVFTATNRGGKSSLAASLLQAGHPLLSDDLVGIQDGEHGFEGRPGFSSMRLWPDQAAHFHDDWEGLTLAHPSHDKRLVPIGSSGFGSFRDEVTPIAAIYLPDRRTPEEGGSSIELVPLSGPKAAIELVRGSFIAGMVEAAGLARQRLTLFGRLAASVPVKRLVYPEGAHLLPRVRESILEDMRRTARGQELVSE